MASRILLPSRLPLFVGLGASSLLLSPLSPLIQRRVLHLDSTPVAASPKDWSFSQYERDAKTPIVKKRGGLNPKAVKQLSTGSILGLVGGLAVSTFSKSLALLIGLMIFGVQVRGYTFGAQRMAHADEIWYGRLTVYRLLNRGEFTLFLTQGCRNTSRASI